jgi:predicted TPR repeat methyltransferase
VALPARGHRVTGIDVAPSMVRLARETGAYEDVQQADAVALPRADEAFDLAAAFMSVTRGDVGRTASRLQASAMAFRLALRALVRGSRCESGAVAPL